MKFIQFYLRLCVKILFFKYNPRVVAIVGENNRQITKDTIAEILKSKISIRVTPPDYNTKISLPLGILGLGYPKKKALSWLSVLIDSISVAFFFSDYPKTVIADIDVSEKGQGEYYSKFLKPRVVILTNLGEQKSKEFLKIAELVSAKGLVILNQEDEKQKNIDYLAAKIKFYSPSDLPALVQYVENYLSGKYVY